MIKTDNSAVIATLEQRVKELEIERDGLAAAINEAISAFMSDSFDADDAWLALERPNGDCLARRDKLASVNALRAFANKFTPVGKLGDMIDGEWNEYTSADEIVDEAFDEAERLRREANNP